MMPKNSRLERQKNRKNGDTALRPANSGAARPPGEGVGVLRAYAYGSVMLSESLGRSLSPMVAEGLPSAY